MQHLKQSQGPIFKAYCDIPGRQPILPHNFDTIARWMIGHPICEHCIIKANRYLYLDLLDLPPSMKSILKYMKTHAWNEPEREFTKAFPLKTKVLDIDRVEIHVCVLPNFEEFCITPLDYTGKYVF